jgi:hypothetical protein
MRFKMITVTLAILFLAGGCLSGGEWVASGTVVKKKSFVLTAKEAEELAIKKRKLELEVEFQKQRVEFYKTLSDDAKKILKYHKEKSDDFREKWIEAENRKEKKDARKSFVRMIIEGVVLGKVLNKIKF